MSRRNRSAAYRRSDDLGASSEQQSIESEPLEDSGETEPEAPEQEKASMEAESLMQPAAPEQPEREEYIAIRRVRYMSSGNIVEAEPSEPIVSPHPKDLQDMIDHNCVVKMSAGKLKAAQAALSELPPGIIDILKAQKL